jgi:predicted XRE-type DNA-binding protein
MPQVLNYSHLSEKPVDWAGSDVSTPSTVEQMPRTKRKRAPTPSVISKDVLAKEINRVLDEKGLTQTEAAWMIQDSPSQLSLISTGKLRGFSSERLLRILTRLGRDVEIRIAPAKGSAGKVRVSIR